MNALRTLILTLVLGASFLGSSEAVRLRNGKITGLEGKQVALAPQYNQVGDADVFGGDDEVVAPSCPQMALNAAKKTGAWLVNFGLGLLAAGYSYGKDVIKAGVAKIRGNHAHGE